MEVFLVLVVMLEGLPAVEHRLQIIMERPARLERQHLVFPVGGPGFMTDQAEFHEKPKIDKREELEGGRKLTLEQVLALENLLQQNSSNQSARLQLIAYYRRKSKREAELRIDHLMWMLENCPNDTVWRNDSYMSFEDSYSPRKFAQAREMWLQQIEKYKNASNVAGNAGLFLIGRDFELGERLLSTAIELDSDDYNGSYWPERLSTFAYLKALEESGRHRVTYATKSLWASEIFLRRLGTDGMLWRTGVRQLGLERCLLCSLWTNDMSKANDYAQQLKSVIESWDHAPKSSRAILSILALRAGAVADATAYLLDTEAGPSLDEFDIELANELITAGQGMSVKRHLEACKQHGLGNASLDRWIKALGQRRKITLS